MANLKDIGYGVGKYLEASDASDIPDIGTNRTNLDLLNFKVATNNAYTLYNFKDGMIDAYQTQEGVDTAGSTGETYDSTNKYYTSQQSLVENNYSYTGSTTTLAVVTGTTYTIKTWGAGGGNGAQGEASWQAGAAGGYSTGTYSFGANTTLVIGVGGLGTKGNSGGTGGWPGGGPRGAFTGSNQGGANGGGYSGVFVGSQAQANSLQIAGGGGGGYYYGPHGGAVAGGGGGTSGTDSTSGSGGSQSAGGTQSGGGSGSALQGGTGGNGNSGIGGAGGGGGYYGGAGSGGYLSGGGSGGGGSGFVATTATINSIAVTAESTGATTASVGTSMNSPGSSDSKYPGGGIGNEQTNGAAYISYTPTSAMTLISNAQTAQADPTEGRLMLYEEDVDAITLDTDLKGYVSRDGGTTYTQTPLVEDIIYESQAFNQGGIDANTALMLHFDGSNGGTTFTDNAPSPHTIMVSGNTNTSTAQKKFGTASGYFDGTGDFLRIATSGDGSYVMGTGNFTVDFWAYDVKVADPDSTVVQIGRGQFGACIGYVHSGGNFVLYLSSSNGGWQIASAVSMGALPGAAWAHYALVRNGNTWTTYKDGTQVSQFSSSASLYVGDEDMQIGRYTYTDNSTTNEMEGYIDELRVSKGVARWTADFTPPTAPYSTGAAAEAYTRRLVSGSVDISGQPSGTDMKYKVETLNNKNLKLHGASLLWA